VCRVRVSFGCRASASAAESGRSAVPGQKRLHGTAGPGMLTVYQHEIVYTHSTALSVVHCKNQSTRGMVAMK